MTAWWVLAAAVAVLVLSRFRLRNGPTITLRDLPRAVAALTREGRDGDFLVVLFGPTGEDGGRLNLQFSIEDDRLGIDWVLLSGANVADRARIVGFVQARGHVARELEMNGVRYLRVEDGDLAGLAHAILSELYRVGPGAPLDLIVEGFTFE